jgi:hypothetical protein
MQSNCGEVLATVRVVNEMCSLGKQNMLIQIEHQGKRVIYELKPNFRTLAGLKPSLSQHFALPETGLFFKLNDEILLPDQELRPLMFPLINSIPTKTMPSL